MCSFTPASRSASRSRLASYCEELCHWSPITLRLLKRGMVKSLETSDMEQQLRYELSNIRIAFSSEDAGSPQSFLRETPTRLQGKIAEKLGPDAQLFRQSGVSALRSRSYYGPSVPLGIASPA